MSEWYYVDGSERVGPKSLDEMASLMNSNVLNEESYVWTAGYDNWARLGDVDELVKLIKAPELPPQIEEEEDIPPIIEEPEIIEYSWDTLKESDKVINVKIGLDRGGQEVEYGPYTMSEIRRAFSQKRMNGKTLVFIPGESEWIFLSEVSIFSDLFPKKSGKSPVIIDQSTKEKRESMRKPFIAKMFVHDQNILLEGVCRDISTGGLQVLVSNSPFSIGEEITLNVHPDNTDYHFVANGLVVRNLDANQGFALRFVDLDSEAEGAITNYLQSH